MAEVPGSGLSFDQALNLINRAAGMLHRGEGSESQREGSSSSDVQYLPAASTLSSAGSAGSTSCHLPSFLALPSSISFSTVC